MNSLMIALISATMLFAAKLFEVLRSEEGFSKSDVIQLVLAATIVLQLATLRTA